MNISFLLKELEGIGISPKIVLHTPESSNWSIIGLADKYTVYVWPRQGMGTKYAVCYFSDDGHVQSQECMALEELRELVISTCRMYSPNPEEVAIIEETAKDSADPFSGWAESILHRKLLTLEERSFLKRLAVARG